MTKSLDPGPGEHALPDAVDAPEMTLVDSQWQRNLLRPLLIIALTTAMLTGPIALAERISGETRLYALLPLFLFVAIIAVYTRIWLADPSHRWFRDTRTRLGEVVLLLVLLRLVIWYIQRQTFDLDTLRLWFENPLTFFDNLYIYSALLLMLGWRFAGNISLIFVDLGLRSDELVDYRKAGLERAWVQALPSNRKELLDRYGELWMWGGIILVLSAALSRVEFQPQPGRFIGLRTLGLPPEILLALLFYFFGGLFLLSQGRLAVLRARWHLEYTPGVDLVTKRWHWSTFKIILGVALVASLLPFGSSYGLAMIISALISVLVFIYFGIISLFGIALSALLSLFGLGIPEDMPNQAPLPMPTPVPTPEAPSTPLLPLWVPGATFWMVLVVLVIYLTVWFLKRRQIKFGAFLGWWSRLEMWWKIVRGQAVKVAQRTRKRLRTTTIDIPLSLPPRAWPFVRLGALSPTERTRYFYLSTVRRAGQLGVKRVVSQTPLEYEENLHEHWPDLESDLHALTDSFLHARYQAKPIDETEAGRARKAWEQIKTAFRVQKKQDSSEHAKTAAKNQKDSKVT